MLDDLMASLGARISAYQDHGDPGPVLNPQAVSDAELVWQLAQQVTPDGSIPTNALYLMVRLYVARVQASGDGSETDATTGLALISMLLPRMPPEHIPAEWRPLRTDSHVWATEAGYILQRRKVSGLPALNHAVELFRRLLDHTTPADSEYPGHLSNLALALHSRFDCGGDPADLDAAIDLNHQAVTIMPPGHPLRATPLGNLQVALRDRADATADLTDLETAIRVGREALRLTAPDDPVWVARLSVLAADLRTRYLWRGDPSDLGTAIGALHDALHRTARDDTERRAALLSDLALAMRDRFEHAGAKVDLAMAIDHARRAVMLTPTDSPHLPWAKAVLSLVLQTRHGRGGGLGDLEAAVQLGRQAVVACPPGSPRRNRCVQVLAFALSTLYSSALDRDVLDEAIGLIRDALADAAPCSTQRTELLSNLANLLGTRAGTSGGQPADVEEEVALAREAARALPPGHVGRPLAEYNVAKALLARFESTGDQQQLRAALEHTRAALTSMPPSHWWRTNCLALLSAVSHARYQIRGEPSDLREAVDAARAAVALTEDLHANRAPSMLALANALRSRFLRTGEPAAAQEAMATWRQTVGLRTARTQLRVAAARSLGAFAADLASWPAALDAYATAVGLLPLLAWRGADRAGRERLLAGCGGLAQDAAACAISAGQPERAVELLDHGRAVLWSQVLEHRTELNEPRERAPQLATSLDQVRAELDQPGTEVASLVPHHHPGDRAPGDADRRVSLTRQWESLIDDVRAVPGLESFLRPPGIRDLRAAAAGGAIILVNVSRWRCDALILTTNDVRVVPLPGLTLADVTARSNQHLRALAEVGNPAAESGRTRLSVVIEREEALTDTLGWLWDRVAEPVLSELEPAASPQSPSRVWWCPTGPLSLLPLHAAGHHDGGPAGRTVLDRVVSSYTPTLRSLARAREAPAADLPGAGRGRLLIIALPDAPGQPPLPGVDREADLLTNLFPGPAHTLLRAGQATRPAVEHALATHAWVHFGCHGNQDLVSPSHGGLLLHDARLTVADLSRLRQGGQFAFLSACHTAASVPSIPDEAITLAAALQYAGYRHVVGTLWSVPDSVAGDVSERVYRNLIGAQGARAAEALHQAAITMRDRAPHIPSTWASFIHLGS